MNVEGRSYRSARVIEDYQAQYSYSLVIKPGDTVVCGKSISNGRTGFRRIASRKNEPGSFSPRPLNRQAH